MVRHGLSLREESLKSEEKKYCKVIWIVFLILFISTLIVTSVSAETYNVLDSGSSGDPNVLGTVSGNLDTAINSLPVENNSEINIQASTKTDVSITNLVVYFNEIVPISLRENPTTGYTWQVTTSSGLEIMSDDYIADNTSNGIVGAGGVHTWTVRAIKSGNQSFSAVLTRSPGKLTGEEETYTLNISVIKITDDIIIADPDMRPIPYL